MEPISKGIHRFTDPLKYFKIRITLRKVTSNVLLEQRQKKNDEIQREKDDLQMKQMTTEADVDKYVFFWQEKVFSQDEFEWYSQKREYHSFLENKYHQDVTEKIRNEVLVARRLFSYTEADISGPKVEHQKGSIIKDEHSTLRLRRTCNMTMPPQRWKNPYSGYVKPSVVKNKTESRNDLTLPSQCMYIMADLQSHVTNGGSTFASECSEEVVLCKIEVDSNGVLRITPDFTQEKPYCIQNSRDEKFDYTIENVSQQPTKKDAAEERELKKELYRKYMDIIRSNVGNDFQMPPIEVLKLFAFGEIVSAVGFDGFNLCIFYYVDLPKKWTTNDSSWLTGVTQRCKKAAGCEDVAYFSFPFEGELTLTLGNVDSEDASITPPTLVMEVLSYDNWGCVRTEGYGHMPLPLLPGSYNMDVSSWRPVGTSLKSKMQHYFTGGLTDLEDMTYVAIPNTFEGKEMSRLGFTTETSGKISLRIHIAQQSRYFIKSGNRKTELLDKLTAKSQDSIAVVLSAFQQARQRMLAARQKILTSK